MGTIYYVSNGFNEIFPLNSRSKFQCEIKKELIPIEDGEIVFASIRKIVFENKYETKSNSTNSHKIEILALKSNLNNLNVLNNKFSNILCNFRIDINREEEEIIFNNPTFFPTTRDKLAHADFEIINFETKNQINFSNGSPTIIEVELNKNMLVEDSLNVFLSSDHSESKNCFPLNRGSNFNILLPSRSYFYGDYSEWKMCLKSITLSNDMYNIFSDKCYIKIQRFTSIISEDIIYQNRAIQTLEKKILNRKCEEGEIFLLEERLNNYIKVSSGEEIFNIPSCKISNVEDLMEKIKEIVKSKIMLSFKNNLASFELNKKIRSAKIDIGINSKYYNHTHLKVSLSPSISAILGIEGKFDEHFSFVLNSLGKRKYKQKVDNSLVNLNYLLPKTLMVLCNIISPSIYGNKREKILKILTNEKSKSNLRNLEYEFKRDEFAKLEIKSFESIEIKILDITGEELEAEFKNPTRIFLNFKKEIS